ALVSELNGFRASLATQLKDKAVIIGWTATGAIADFVPTSLSEKCPGPVVHGVIFNGIMTGELWRRSPWWVTALISIGIGMLTAVVVGRLQPVRAALVAIAIA